MQPFLHTCSYSACSVMQSFLSLERVCEGPPLIHTCITNQFSVLPFQIIWITTFLPNFQEGDGMGCGVRGEGDGRVSFPHTLSEPVDEF